MTRLIISALVITSKLLNPWYIIHVVKTRLLLGSCHNSQWKNTCRLQGYAVWTGMQTFEHLCLVNALNLRHTSLLYLENKMFIVFASGFFLKVNLISPVYYIVRSHQHTSVSNSPDHIQSANNKKYWGVTKITPANIWQIRIKFWQCCPNCHFIFVKIP